MTEAEQLKRLRDGLIKLGPIGSGGDGIVLNAYIKLNQAIDMRLIEIEIERHHKQ